MQTLQVNAYAKINAYLEITGQREDGYHTILSHMQAVTLHDTLKLTWDEDAAAPFSICLTTSDLSLACDDTNLVCRAARAFANAAKDNGISVGGALTVYLQKDIPMAAGLAGGSADAAAVLRGMNELFHHPFRTQELCEIAVKLGADVPFCVCSAEQTAMTARGIGELLTPAPALPPDTWMVIACHGEGVLTPWAYRRLDELGKPNVQQTERAYADYLSALECGDLDMLAVCAHNCFERVVLSEREAVPMLIDEMVRHGAVFARMSGSGPSVVGFFKDEEGAALCAEYLRAEKVNAHVCRAL